MTFIHQEFQYAPSQLVASKIKRYMRNVHDTFYRDKMMGLVTYEFLRHLNLRWERNISVGDLKNMGNKPKWYQQNLGIARLPKSIGSFRDKFHRKTLQSGWNRLFRDENLNEQVGLKLFYTFNNPEYLAWIGIYDSQKIAELVGDFTSMRTEVVAETTSSKVSDLLPQILDHIVEREFIMGDRRRLENPFEEM